MRRLTGTTKEPTARAEHMAETSPDRSASARSSANASGAGARAARPALVEHRITIPSGVSMVELLGMDDQVLRAVESGFTTVDVHARGNEISLAGPAGDVALVARLVDELVEMAAGGTPLTPDVVTRSVAMLTAGTATRPADVLSFNILSNRGRTIRAKTAGQKEYVDAIDRNTITFGIGPAGTGKTYLAMAKAVQALQARQVNRIVLTRPAVEAGERLGFLPAACPRKSTRTCARSTTPCTTWSTPSRSRA